MKLVVLGSGNLLINFLDRCRKNEAIEIMGVVNMHIKNDVVEATDRQLKSRKIASIDLAISALKQADCILAINYAKILPAYVCESLNIINLHVGILPKYRGNSANTWAIMNGEEFVGFTVHSMTAQLDAGDIYYVKKIPIGRQQTYSDVYDLLMEAIMNETPAVLLDIYNGNLEPRKQYGNYIYGTMFSADMGVIKNFDIDSRYMFNLYRCMAKPHGTGIWFYKDGQKYEVGRVSLGSERGVDDYIGIPGKVVNTFQDELWVKTRDNVVIFDRIYKDGIPVNIGEIFRNGQFLK